MLATRIVLAIAALAAGTWLVVAERGARAQEALVASAFAPGTPDTGPAAGVPERARRWSPDQQPNLTYGLLRERAGDLPGAIRTLRGVVEREPENADAWRLLADAARRGDPPLAARAQERLRELVPPVPPPAD